MTKNPTPTSHTIKRSPSLHRSRLMRMMFMLLGGIFLGIGIVGVALPVLPTTPFILLTAACWARSSKRFHHWLINHPVFGDMVKNWQQNRAIPRGAKYLAWSMMTLSCSILFYRLADDLQWLAWLTSFICLSTAVWMARLPDA